MQSARVIHVVFVVTLALGASGSVLAASADKAAALTSASSNLAGKDSAKHHAWLDATAGGKSSLKAGAPRAGVPTSKAALKPVRGKQLAKGKPGFDGKSKNLVTAPRLDLSGVLGSLTRPGK